MHYCSNCGSVLPEGAAVCPSCGAAVPAAGHVPPGYAPPPPPPQPGFSPAPGYGYVPPAQTGGLSINSVSALCYLLGLVTGIIFLVLEPYKRDRTVRFHAFQSIFLNLAWIVFWIVWGVVSATMSVVTHGLFVLVSLLVNMVLGIGFLVIWIMLMVKAAQGQKWVLPVVGPLAEKQAASGQF